MRFLLVPLLAVTTATYVVSTVGVAGAQPYAFERQLDNPEPAAFGDFGRALAFLGTTRLVVGAEQVPDRDKVFVIDLATGKTLQRLSPPPSFTGDAFGESVAVVGTTIVVGTSGSLLSGIPAAGTVFVYDGDTGALLRTIDNPTPALHDGFGLAVAAVGNTILVGAPGDDTAADDSGAAYAFDADTGGLLHTFVNPSGEEDDYFGGSVAALGGDFLVGHSGYGAAGTLTTLGNDVIVGSSDGFALETYRFDGTTGALLQTYAAPATPTSAVHIFDGTSGTLLRTLTPPPFGNIYQDIQFGRSVTTIGPHLIVGEFGIPYRGLRVLGAVFMFDEASGALEQTILAHAPDEADDFGWAVLAAGGRLAISVPTGDRIKGAGRVQVFDVCGDGVRAPGEQCDDGNVLDGDGCSATCHLELCAPTPRVDCRHTLGAGSSKLAIGGQRDDAKNQLLDEANVLKWSWTDGAATSTADLADPRTGIGYALCLYDASGGSQPLLNLGAPSGDAWRAGGATGFRYGTKPGFPDGIASLRVRSGPDGTPKIAVAGEGATFHLPALPLVAPLTVQLVNGDTGVCWDATFSTLATNDGVAVKARGD